MLQVRLHGRGGQGVVTAAEMLSLAAFLEGHFAQAFPSFGSERTGAPVVAYARIDDKEIRTHEPILEPDVVLVQDRTLLSVIDVFSGISPNGYAIINSADPAEQVVPELCKKLPKGHVLTVPATQFAMEKLKKPLPGAPMLSSLAAATDVFKLESVQKSFQTRYPGKVGDANAETAALAYNYLKEVIKGGANA
ncbi:MAG: 2-oxoacid:acceptor oxidoreductase family protein [Succinivibrio sp.]|nr:2-oxoacid:acceptor oxidoreductase family protein [Succinivibrio sp.]